MTRSSPTSSRCCCCASRSGGIATMPLAGDGRLTDKLRLPYQLTGAQRRVIEEIRGDMAQSAPMLRLLQGDVGSGKTLVALLAMLAAVESGAQAALLAPTEILARQHHATLLSQLDSIGVRVAILTGREKGRARESVLMGLADGSIDILVGTHAIFQEKVALQEARPRGDRRAASLRRVAAPAAVGQGRAPAASAGDDRDADPAHADADPIWRDGRQPHRRDAAGPEADRNAGDQRGEIARRDRRPRPPYRERRPGLLGVPAGRGERENATPPPPRSARGCSSCASATTRSGWSMAG